MSEVIMKVCAAWMCLEDKDDTRVKFWARRIACTERKLKETMEQARYHVNNRTGVKNNDPSLKIICNEMSKGDKEGAKRIFLGVLRQSE